MPDDNTNKDRGTSHSVTISESKETDGIDDIKPAGHSPSERSSLAHKPPYFPGLAETDEYEARRREAFNENRAADLHFSDVSINNNGINS